MTLVEGLAGQAITWRTHLSASEIVERVRHRILKIDQRFDQAINPLSKAEGFIGEVTERRLYLLAVPGQNNLFRWRIDVRMRSSDGWVLLEGYARPAPEAWATLAILPAVISLLLSHAGPEIALVAGALQGAMLLRNAFNARHHGRHTLSRLRSLLVEPEAS